MRHLRVCAVAQPHSSVRTKMTGFNLFTKSMQQERRVLKAKSFETGHLNMRIMAKLWRQLPGCRRAVYNERALQRDAFMSSDPEKKNNTFNLLMKLFSGDKVLLKAGDQCFTALMAKSTMHAMRTHDVRRLRAKLNVKKFCTSKERPYVSMTSFFKRFVSPDMMLFDSFTDMQRSVAPTRRSAFTAVVKSLSVSNITVSGEEDVMKRYKTLSPELRNLFAPISDSEAPFFEMFCASRCAGFSRKRFEIMRLFAAFRGIEIDLGSNTLQDELFRSFINTDRSRDGIYFRARRSLERLEALRSSDCGLFIAKRFPGSAKVDPSAYGIDSCLDDVTVATALAETRNGCSVYDDVITRASILRAKSKSRQLSIYNVAQMIPSEVLKHSQMLKDKLHHRRVTPELNAAKLVANLKTALVYTGEKSRSSVRVINKMKSLKLKAKQECTQNIDTLSKVTVPKEMSKASPEKKSSSVLKRRRRGVRSINIFRTRVKKANAPRRSPVKTDTSVDIVAAARKRTIKKGIPIPQVSAASDTQERSLFLGNMMADDGGDSHGSDFLKEVVTLDIDQTKAQRAPSGVRKAARRRATRSHLLIPESMLPATARSQKMIEAHTSTHRKSKRSIPTTESSPFTPVQSKMSFADSIRAQLATTL